MTLADELAAQRAAWETRPLLRKIYRDWFRLIETRLAGVPGPTIELGSGIGTLAEVVPRVERTDVEPTPWSERVVDAEALPYEDATVANLVLVDVFHHLPRPGRFLDEARRALAPGGRVVMLEPYCSPLSALGYRLHHERLELDASGFAEDPVTARSPMEANLAQTTLAFFRQTGELRRRWPELELAERRLLSLFLYPLSGGFSRRQLVPDRLYGPLAALERLLSPLAPLAAWRCLIVLARRP